jgi:homoserine kinase
VVITRRPGPLEVRVRGAGAGELPLDERNLLCRAMAGGLATLDGLLVECTNRIPMGSGLGSSSAAVCAGLVAANALGGLRWSPDELLRRATELEGHADNAAACLEGGIVAVSPDPVRARRIPPPDGLAFCVVVPAARVSTERARKALPAAVPLRDAADTLARAVGLVLALGEGRLDDLPALLPDRLHEPYRGPLCPGLEALRGVAADGLLGVTISGSGPSMLMWCHREAVGAVAAAARTALGAAGVEAEVRVERAAPQGVRARWGGTEQTRLARAVG